MRWCVTVCFYELVIPWISQIADRPKYVAWILFPLRFSASRSSYRVFGEELVGSRSKRGTEGRTQSCLCVPFNRAADSMAMLLRLVDFCVFRQVFIADCPRIKRAKCGPNIEREPVRF